MENKDIETEKAIVELEEHLISARLEFEEIISSNHEFLEAKQIMQKIKEIEEKINYLKQNG